MGDRYGLQLKCAYCGAMNDGVYYAPSSGVTTFDCEKCGKENAIAQEFRAEKLTRK